jgi:hypothetical protein
VLQEVVGSNLDDNRDVWNDAEFAAAFDAQFQKSTLPEAAAQLHPPLAKLF